MRTIRLDVNDVNRLITLKLNEASNNEISETKGDLRKQALQNINNLVSSGSVGSIVALFLFVLTDKKSVMSIRQISAKFDNYLSAGGKEVDFSASVVKSLRPVASRFVEAVVDAVEKKAKTYSKSGILGRDYTQKYLNDDQNDDQNDVNDDDNYYDLRASTKKQQLRVMAMKGIKQLANSKELYRVVSLFLFYLTDKDTVSTLKSFASTYGKQLDEYIDGYDPDWTENLIAKVRNKFVPLIQKMVDSIPNESDKTKVGENTKKQTSPEFKEDREKISQIVQKYNIT